MCETTMKMCLFRFGLIRMIPEEVAMKILVLGLP